jgi:hypothetical protein
MGCDGLPDQRTVTANDLRRPLGAFEWPNGASPDLLRNKSGQLTAATIYQRGCQSAFFSAM